MEQMPMDKMKTGESGKQSWQWTIVYIIVAIIAVVSIYYFLSYAGNVNKRLPAASSPSVSNQNQEPTRTGVKNIAIENFKFTPNSVNLKKGESIAWTNRDSAPHTVTSDSGAELSSGTLNTGNSYTHIFNTVGIFEYHCAFHPYMHGTVIVSE